MEPADVKPECDACGATEGIHNSGHFGWLCDDVEACILRSRWAPGRDIPEQAQVVVFVPPYHKEVLSGEAAEAAKELMRHTIRADLARTCRLCGLGGDLARSEYGWVHEACLLEDDSETDYEALGYRETGLWETRKEEAIELVADIWARGPVWSILEEMAVVVGDNQKDIRTDSDSS